MPLSPQRQKQDKRKQQQQAGSAAHAACSCIKRFLLYYQTATTKTPTLYTMSVLANCQPLEHQNLRKLANAGAHRASKHPPHQGYSELTPRAHRASKHPPHLNTLHIRANTEDCSGQLRDCNPNPPSAKPTSAMAVENAAIRRSYSKPPYVANLAARNSLGIKKWRLLIPKTARRTNTLTSYRHRTPYVSRIAVSPNRWSLSSYLMPNVISPLARLAWNNGPVEVRDQRMF